MKSPATRAAWRGMACLAALATSLAAVVAPATADQTASTSAPSVSAANSKVSDPSAPFTLPTLNAQTVISNPDQLRTGGVNCTQPADLAASNAGDGSGKGYRVPFTMALTDGRTLAGYSGGAKAAGQMPFGSGVIGITGWVRGWVNLPSLKIVVPSDGVTICPGSSGYWSTFNLFGQLPNAPTGAFTGLSACPACFLTTTFNVSVAGPVQASLDGVASDGSLRLQASMPLSVNVQTHYSFQSPDSPNLDCVTDGTLNFSTDKTPLVKKYEPVSAPFTKQDYVAAGGPPDTYQAQYPVTVDPPDHYYMPPSTLAGATPGATATLADATFSLTTPKDDPAKPGHCDTNGANGSETIAGPVLSPKDLQGNAPINANNAYAYVIPGEGWPMQAGSAQASVDATISSIGMQEGMPDGYGFK